MDATALRAGTQAVTPTTSTSGTATTNGPSSSGPTAGGGPVPAPQQPTLLGVKLLPAPAGEPKTIHLNDGSMLVPLAKVGADGATRPLTGGGAATAPAAPAAPAAPTAPATGGTSAVPAAGGTETKGFLYRGNYYKKFEDNTAIDIANLGQVEEKVTRGTLNHVKEDEPDWHGFGVTEIKTRRVDPVADRDLLNVDPQSVYYVEVSGRTGTGEHKMIPSVVEADGDVFVDPRIRGY